MARYSYFLLSHQTRPDFLGRKEIIRAQFAVTRLRPWPFSLFLDSPASMRTVLSSNSLGGSPFIWENTGERVPEEVDNLLHARTVKINLPLVDSPSESP